MLYSNIQMISFVIHADYEAGEISGEKTPYINIFNIMRHLVIVYLVTVWNKPMPNKYAKYTKIWYLFQLSACKEVIEM